MSLCVLQILTAFAQAEKLKKPPVFELFNEVYKEMPWHIDRQMNEVKEHIIKYKDKYPLDKFEEWKD